MTTEETGGLAASLAKFEEVLAKQQTFLEELAKSKDSAGGKTDMEKSLKTLERTSTQLQSKLDVIVRQLDDISTAQKKMQKVVQDLQKSVVKERETSKSEENGKYDKNQGATTNGTDSAAPKQQNSEWEKTRWAQNLAMVGDGVWLSLANAEDVKEELVAATKAQPNFRVNCKEDEVLSRLFDSDRDRVLFALPARVSKVALSIGTYDLMSNEALITLKDASLEEVRKKNGVILNFMADVLFRMTSHLLSQDKVVILLLPPHGQEKIEVFKQWEDIVLERAKRVTNHKFKVINLPGIMFVSPSWNFGSCPVSEFEISFFFFLGGLQWSNFPRTKSTSRNG